MKRICCTIVAALMMGCGLPVEGDSLYHSRYVNCDYGYRVDLPAGLIAHGDIPPAPNHGFGIDLRSPKTTQDVVAEQVRDYLYVGAEYNSRESKSPADEIASRLDDLQRLHNHPDARIVSRSKVRLGGLTATRAKVVYAPGRIKEWIIAFRRGIIYEFSMTTRDSTYDADMVIVNDLIRGFRMMPLPRGECSNRGAQ